MVSARGVNGTAVLDGFTITAGKANGTQPDYWGGGFLCDGSEGKTCNPALINITFAGNFDDNAGGAMFNIGKNGTSSPALTNVTFSGNSALCCGGAIYNYGEKGISSPILTNVCFSGNSADGYEISGSGTGGAMWNDGYEGTSNPILNNVVFSGNSAPDDGGAMYKYSYNGGSSKAILNNVTFSRNAAGRFGGAIVNDGSNGGNTNPELRNTIVWNNKDKSGIGTISASIYLTGGASVSVTYSLVQGTGASGDSWIGGSNMDGGGNIDQNPLFITAVNRAAAPGKSGDLHLQENSPAKDAGDNKYVTTPTDLDGNPRIVNNKVDMGAYEYQIPYKHDINLPIVMQ